jgi:hypothetical protein
MDKNYIFSTLLATMSCATVGIALDFEEDISTCPEQSIEIPIEHNPYLFSAKSSSYLLNLNISSAIAITTKKNFRERYKKISQSNWFKKTHLGMSIGEVITIDE